MFNLRSIDLNLLTVFEAIYELGSVTAAADRLALSQSAASHALSRLRDVCKDDLFIRAPQGLSPTPVAKEIYPAIKQALDGLRTSLAEASGFIPAQSQRHFRISIPHPLGPFYALDLKAAGAAVAPGVLLTFDTVSRPINLEDNIRDGIVDLVIDWLPIELDPFINQKLFDDRLVLLARRDHPSVKGRVTLADLQKEKLIGGHRRRDIERLPQAIREFYKLELPGALRVSELLEIPTIVAGTDLLGMFAESMGPILKERFGLQVLSMPIELPAVPIYMIWHETRRNDAAHRWLRELVATKLKT
jgi:DNA-binding transcriptional LysR family regulator